MIAQVINNSAMTAKVHAMRREKLNAEDYQRLTEARSVADLTSYLHDNTCYKTALNRVNYQDMHREKLEEVLKASIREDYEKLATFANGSVKRFLRLYLLRNEIDDLKGKIRTAESFDSIMEYVKTTKYYKILSPFIKNESHQDVFNMEMALDIHYFKLAWLLCNRVLSGTDRKLAQRTLSLEIDLLNISFVIRMKKYYNLSGDSIYPYVIPHYKKLSRNDIKAMVESEHVEALMEIVSRTTYAKAFGHSRFLEKNIIRFIGRVHRNLFKLYPYSISAPLAYLHFKDIEIKNIITITEGIRYSLSRNEIEKHIIKI